uniref:Anoctamin n=1 Tax=Phallusia mammillata TaxID=59560 RepID=A0A6F9D781_9ASCI|nr:anoctamin-5 [Phallusia mammillata]
MEGANLHENEIGKNDEENEISVDVNILHPHSAATEHNSDSRESCGSTSSLMRKRDEHQTKKRPKATLYFKDGVRYIDYVIAYEEDEDDPKNNDKREVFERGLDKKGLILEREPKEQSQDQKTCFVKIHVPWDVCLKYAERMKMKMPLKEDRIKEPVEEDDGDIDCSCITNAWKKVLRPFTLDSAEVLEKTEPDCYTAEFTKEKMDYFDIKDEKTFFTTSERSRIAYRIMSETRFGPKPIQVGIVQLIGDGAYKAAFPLHEGRHTNNQRKMATDDNMRRLLYWEWARWGRWYKFQPLDLIRQYLGDKVALYFAWLGYYTEMLVYPTLVGLIVFIYSIATLWTYPPTRVQEVCDETYPTYAGNLTMCPVCDADCGYWQLGSTCLSAQVTHVFDNEATIFFAVFMSLWATMFLELWKRKQFRLAYDWDLVDYDEDRDLIRPEFEAQVTRERLNPITGQREPYLSAKDRYTRACLSITTVFFWVLVVIAAVFAVIVYRLVIAAVFASSVDLSSLGSLSSVATPSMLTTITASLLSLIIIMCLNFVYEKMALILTDMELPRTQIEFDDSFTFKMFCFQFVNFYSYLFYVAFFKQTFAGYPANYTYLFGEFRWDECDAGGCMYELSIQLIIIMLGKQIWNNVIELMMPWMINKYRQYKSTKVSDEQKDNEYTRWEQDYDLTAFRQMGLFYEYLEMVIQFGFVTLFVAAFPLAPVLALINNIIEIRLDANKFICELRRPLSQKCSDIGAWYYLLDFLGTLAVVTNAFTIAITSDAIPKMVYYYSYSSETYGFNTLQGYTNNSLSYFNVKDFNDRSIPTSNPLNVTVCRYRDYRAPPSANPPYALTMQYWHVIASRLAFVIVMEHIVFALKRFLDYLVPDRPRRLKQKIKREHFLVQQMLLTGDERNPQTPYSGSPTKSSSGNKFFVENEKKMTPL